MVTSLDELPLRKRLVWVGIVAFVLGTAIVVGTSLQNYAQLAMRGDVPDIPVFRMVRWPMIWWYGWVLIAPFCFEFASRRPFQRENWAPTLLIMVVGNIAAYAIHVAWQVSAMYLPAYSMVHDTFVEAVRYHIVISLYLNVFIYWVIVGSANALRMYASAQKRALTAATLEAQLANARLDALKMQLHPHFLFNTLHGISTLMYRDVDAADAMVNRLGRLLRKALDRSDVHEVTFREEMEFLEEYLAIERIRFGDKLIVRFDVDSGIEHLLVPSFVFQPLVENSIKHAIGPQGNQGTIAVSARRLDTSVELSVTDDGPGMPLNEDVLCVGVGLSNLHARLGRMYGDRGVLELEDVPTGGFRVTVTIPARSLSQRSTR